MEDVPKKPNRADIPSCILVEKVWRAFCAVLVVTYFGCCGACLFAAATGAEIAVFTTDLQTDIVLVGTCLLGIFALSWLLKVFLVRYPHSQRLLL